ncbi:MAG: hypothetical protein V7609_1136 [Verrucomicrobiota bacterium]
MKHEAKTHRTRGSVLRPLLAALLMLGGVALLAQAGNFTEPAAASPGGSTQVNQAAAATPGQPRFQNYPAPAGIADDVGEPSIGCNWKTEQSFSNSMFNIPNGGRVMLYGGFSTDLYRATFNDCSSPAKPNWEAKPLVLAATPRAAGDPILFTDHDTGRTFVSQLEGLTPAGSTTDITDDDGDNFMLSEGSDLPSDIDHQTFGGGRFHDPKPPTIGTYPNAVYYASQSVSDARAALSVDGGQTFGPGSPMYTINDCAGLHGHIKVSPKDGTIYVPNMGCGGAIPFHETGAKQAVIISEDNGITWSIRKIPDSTSHGNGSVDNAIIGSRDPSVSIDADGNVYFVYQAEDRLTGNLDGTDLAGDTHPKVAVSHDRGVTWEPSIDVGATVINGNPIRNATFVTATAGSGGRAAVAFFGTETGGNNWACGEGDDCSVNVQGVATGLHARAQFTGVWYLYISTTFDGGKTWTTQNVTPGDPIQRGGICGGGTCRNLLDFMDIQIDKQGRILVAGEDGCIAGCVNGPPNSFTAKGFITRQSGGKRMIAQFDPVEPALAGAPAVTAVMDGAKTKVQLSWPAPDDGGSAITGYKISRRTGAAALFVSLATVTERTFVDTTFDKNSPVFYHVTAVNGSGEGPFCSDIAPTVGIVINPCAVPGVLVDNDLNPDGTDNDAGIPGPGQPSDPRVNIRQLFIAEPFLGAGVNKLVFTLQLGPSTGAGATTPPPASQWYIVWNRQNPDANFDRWYVAMKSDATGALSFEYGQFGVATIGNPNVSTPMKVGDADSGTYNVATGVVTIVLSNSKAENVTAGKSLAGVNVRTYLARPDSGTKTQSTADDITSDSVYTLVGNAACALNQAPTAKLVATPDTGNPPLTVALNGSTSVDPDAGDSIASYTFSFGDGSPDVTQSSPTVSHTYKHGGGFFATLTVKDSKGLQSANVASVPIQVAAQILNLSSRVRVQPGDNALIGGLIIRGSEPKKVTLRGIGPSLTANGQPLPGRLADPTLELYNSANVVIAMNDDWITNRAEIEAAGFPPPTNDKESAIVKTLDPGSYTVVMRGKGNSSGIGVVETYDIGLEANARLANLSSRGFIGTGDDILIGGFFAGPQTAAVTRVVVRALGPSLAQFNVPQPMQDPTIEVRNRDGNLVRANDNWQTDQKTEIEATGLQPSDIRESAIVLTNFEPGPYTAIVKGKGGAVGVGLVEIFDVQK